MELPPLRQIPGLFALTLVLSLILVVFQSYLRTNAINKVHRIINDVGLTGYTTLDLHRTCPVQETYRGLKTPSIFVLGDEKILNTTKPDDGLPIVMNVSSLSPRKKTINNIVLFKGHRAGGGSVQNIILRYAMAHKSRILLPPKGLVFDDLASNFAQYLNKTNSSTSYTSNVKVLCHTLVFNQEMLSKLFDHSDTFYIGILRHPLHQTVSAFYHNSKKYSLAFRASPRNPFAAFLNRILKYDSGPPDTSFTNNRQSIDLGFVISKRFESDKTDKNKISKFIETTDSFLDFVIITELFDESVVLLRRLLGWKTKDILYIKTSMSNGNDHLNDITTLSHLEHALHKDWAPIDYAMYDHFKHRLDQIISLQDEGFHKEVKSFRDIRRKTELFCHTALTGSTKDSVLLVKATYFNDEFCVSQELCHTMESDEQKITDLVRAWQQLVGNKY